MRYERRCRRIKAKTCFPSWKALSPCLWQRQNRILLNKNRHYCSIQTSLLSSSRAAFPLPLLWWLGGSLQWPFFPTSPQLQGCTFVMECCFQAYLGILRTHYWHPVEKIKIKFPSAVAQPLLFLNLHHPLHPPLSHQLHVVFHYLHKPPCPRSSSMPVPTLALVDLFIYSLSLCYPNHLSLALSSEHLHIHNML